MIYIVATPGRTGSKLLVQLISNYGTTPGGICNAKSDLSPNAYRKLVKFKDTTNIVFHTHYIDYASQLGINNYESILLVSKRRDTFAALMSMCVGQVTNDWQFYTNKRVNPFTIDLKKFLNLYQFYKQWYVDVYQPTYYKVIDVYYEDIIEYGEKGIADLLNIKQYIKTTNQISPKSPYSYKDLILNWEDLYYEYLQIRP